MPRSAVAATLRGIALCIVAFSVLALLAAAGLTTRHRRLAGISSQGLPGQAIVEHLPERALPGPLLELVYVVTSSAEREVVGQYIHQHGLNALVSIAGELDRLDLDAPDTAITLISADAALREQVQSDQQAISRALAGP